MQAMVPPRNYDCVFMIGFNSAEVEEFLPFGEGTDDTTLSNAAGILILESPFVFYGVSETILYVRESLLHGVGRDSSLHEHASILMSPRQ